MADPETTLPRHANGRAWVGTGMGLLVFAVVLTGISPFFVYGSPMWERPILPFTGLMIGAALVYFYAVQHATHTEATRRLAWWVFAVGAGMRLIVALSTPILEDDFYRYLWDGAVTAHGHNPYTPIPSEVQARDAGVSAPLLQLAAEGGLIVDRVNHAQLGTVYPPVAQGTFALAHLVGPWKLSGLRSVYYGLDLVTFGLIILLLRRLERSPLLSVIYWWNPLAVKEVYNSAHMDIILVPLLLAAMLLVLQGRLRWAMVPLSLAVATKLWPILLLPPLLAVAAAKRPRQALGATLLFTALTGVLLSPLVAIVALGAESGFVAYGTRWEMNDALFMIFPWSISRITALMGFPVSAGTAHRGGKLIAMAIVGAIVVWTTWTSYRVARTASEPWNRVGEGRRCCAGLLWIVAALFLVSPTQFPWYFLWLLPLLTLTPNRALLALTALLPLYYLRFYLDARGAGDLFHYRVVWLEFVPLWILLVLDARRAFRAHNAQKLPTTSP